MSGAQDGAIQALERKIEKRLSIIEKRQDDLDLVVVDQAAMSFRLKASRDDARAAAQVQADEITRLRAELDAVVRDYETLSSVYAEAGQMLDDSGFPECPPDDTIALDVGCRLGRLIEEKRRMTSELQRAHEAGERMQRNYALVADAIAAESESAEQLADIARKTRTSLATANARIEEANDTIRFLKAACDQNGIVHDALRVDLAAAVKRAEDAEAARDGMRGERDDEGEISIGWEDKYENEQQAHAATTAILDEIIAALEKLTKHSGAMGGMAEMMLGMHRRLAAEALAKAAESRRVTGGK